LGKKARKTKPWLAQVRSQIGDLHINPKVFTYLMSNDESEINSPQGKTSETLTDQEGSNLWPEKL
jgi:hypothetical protein